MPWRRMGVSIGIPSFLMLALSGGEAVPYLKRLVAGFSPRWPGFDPRSGYVGFVVDKVAFGQVFSKYFGFPCQSFQQLLHNHHHRSSGAGTIGQQWPTYQADLVSPHPRKWRWVVSFTPLPLYSWGRSPWYPLDRRLGGPQNQSGRCGEEKTS
jgi:hypothetical protein